ncbi:MAG TPA: beta-propeller fold lactonase family protein [Bryobacteraceae bacterium]|nr:beta-propeller fold lactonase family protein [Bryobacteraceae bacterium]
MRLGIVAAGIALLCGCSKAPEKPKGYRIFVTNERSGDLSVIDSTTHEVTATVPLGKRPRGIHASPDGKLIYVALSGSPIAGPGVDESTLPPPDKSADGIGVYDVGQGKVVKMLKSGSDPEEFDISQDGKYLYVSNEDVSGVSILDLTTEKILVTLPTGEEPEGVKVSPDGKFVYATSEDAGMVYKIDAATQKVASSLKVGRRPRTIACMPDNVHAWVNAENDGTVVYFDAVKNEVVETIQLGEAGVVKPMAVLLSKDASKLFVSTGRGKKVFILDTATRKVETSFEVGQRPWGIALSPDGKTLYTANGPSNDMSVVDVATKTVTKKVALTGSPWGVIVLP